MKVFSKLNTNIRTKTLQKLSTISFNQFKINHFSTSSEKISSKSHLQQILERDTEFVHKVTQSHNYTVSDFSNFLRVVSKTKDEELIQKFVQEAPKHISKLDELDMRKIISILVANPSLQEESNLIEMIKSRNSELNHQNGMDIRKNFDDFSKFPLSIRFWVNYAKLREFMYCVSRKVLGINIR